MRVEVLVATMGQNDMSLYEKMNLKTDMIIANQGGRWHYEEEDHDFGRIRMISTDTIGVGVNRNLALELSQADILVLSDDDMTYYDCDLKGVIEAFERHPDADIIFFGLDYSRNGEVFDKRRCKNKRAYVHNSMKYGACRTAIRREAILRHSIRFSTLFGGGCLYGSGEDSIFLCNCFFHHLKAYSDSYVLGVCAKDSSSWFNGYNNKYLFDKGAWLAASFPRHKHLVKWYFIRKFAKLSKKGFFETARLVNSGIKAYKTLDTYKDEE